MGCHSLLQGIFLIQGSNLCLWPWQVDSLPLSHQGSPESILASSYKQGVVNPPPGLNRKLSQWLFPLPLSLKIQAGPEADTAHRPQGALSHCASPSHPRRRGLSIAKTPGWVYQDQFSYSEQKGPCWPAWPHHSSLFLPWICCLKVQSLYL